MADRIVSAEEAQAHLKDLLDLVREGREVLISDGDGDQAFARIAPVALGTPAAAGRRKPGLHRGAIRMAPDFDEPFPDSFWFGKE